MAKKKAPAAKKAADPAGMTVRVGLVQAHAGADPAENLARTLRLLEQAADEGAKAVCTQELFRSTYFCQEEDAKNFALAEPVPGPTTDALAGAKILFYPTAIGTWTGEAALKESQREAWRTIQRSHAVANGVFVAVPNRVGREGELDFWGSSFVARPFGGLLAEGSEDREE